MDKCKLCDKETHLRESHIIPRFAVKWLKETSLTGFMRDLVSKKRQQESRREYILCGDCEELLSKDEKKFCEEIFIPYHEKGQETFEYGPWLKRFLVGLHWLVLAASKVSPPKNVDSIFATASETWQEFLLGKRADPGEYEFHVIFVDVIADATKPIPDKLNWYLARGFDLTPASSKDGKALVYAKLIKIVTVSFLNPSQPRKEEFEGTIVFDQGTLLIRQRINTTHFGRFLEERAQLIEKASPALTQRQLQKLAEEVEKNPERLLSSESYKVHVADRELRQRMASQTVIKGRDRNKPCPCGSGLKAKSCCAGTP